MPKGLCRALHLADSATTGMAEDEQRTVAEAAPVFDTPPESLTLIPVEVDVREVLDVSDPEIQERLGVADEKALTALDLEYRALTALGAGALTLPRRIGTAAFRCRTVSGIRCPSARRRGGVNVVLFEQRLRELRAGWVRATHPLTGDPAVLP